MIGAISLIRRRDDIDAVRFRRHWLDIHGPLVCRMAGLRGYAQAHVVAAVTPVARAMAIDGFAELAFDSVAARTAAYGSAELAACDRDSPGFIGAVSRLVTEATVVIPRPEMEGVAKFVILFPPGAPGDAAPDRAAVERLGARGLIWHEVLEQGRAPNSSVAELHCPVIALAEVWVGGELALEMVGADQAAVFSVTEYRLR
jgi:uncharacterized protein (TIGR02118 family)